MTLCAALERTDELIGAESDGLDQVASVWAVLTMLEKLPATSARKRSLERATDLFEEMLNAAEISEAELIHKLDESCGRAPPRNLHVVED